MAYRVDPNVEVAAQVAQFHAPEFYFWNRSLREIALNPFCRRGTIMERAVATAPFPLIARSYAITCHEYTSGEMVYFLDAQFLPGRTIAYVVYEDEVEVEIIFLRK